MSNRSFVANSPDSGHLVAAAKQQATSATGSPRSPAAGRSRAVAVSIGRLFDAMSSQVASISAASSGRGGGEFSLLDYTSPAQPLSVATNAMVLQGGGTFMADLRSTVARRDGNSDGGSTLAGGHLIARQDTLRTCFWEPTPPRPAAVRAEVEIDRKSQGGSVQTSVESSPGGLAVAAHVGWQGGATASCTASVWVASPGLSTPNSSHYSPEQRPAAALGGNSPDRRPECALRLGLHGGVQHHRHPIFLLQHEAVGRACAAVCSPAESCCGSPAESGGSGTPGASLLPREASSQRRSKPSLLVRLASGCIIGRGGFAVLGSP